MTAGKPKGIFNQPVGTKMPKLKGPKPAAGDYYGTGIKAKVGRMRGGSVGEIPVGQKSLKKPPKSLA